MNQREYLVNAPICQFGYLFLIVHGRNPRLCVCFDKVNNGPT